MFTTEQHVQWSDGGWGAVGSGTANAQVCTWQRPAREKTEKVLWCQV